MWNFGYPLDTLDSKTQVIDFKEKNGVRPP